MGKNSGYEQWMRRMAAENDGGERWRRVVENNGGGEQWWWRTWSISWCHPEPAAGLKTVFHLEDGAKCSSPFDPQYAALSPLYFSSPPASWLKS